MNPINVFASTDDKFERMKIMLLSLTFFFVIGAYTLIYDLKNSIFMSIVGKKYVPWAKMSSMIVLIPAVIFYSVLVDKLRRYQLLCFYSIIFGFMGLISAYCVAHPTIGLANTEASPYRLFGWFFFFFVEGFSPFMVSVFWAFSNSISNPKSAKNNYGLFVTSSKLGGMLTAAIAWCFLSYRDFNGNQLFNDSLNHQLLLILFSLFVLMVPVVILIMMRRVPGSYLHGYKAVYLFEKEKKHEKKEDSGIGFMSGLTMLLKRPYVLGIFGMVLFYEVLNTVLGYQRLGVAQAVSANTSDMSALLYQQMFAMHFIGFFISIIGTRTLLKVFGQKACLVLVPVVSGLLLFYFLFAYTPMALLVVFVLLKSINYAFAQPVRESLYIPTVKDVKFKTKSWIDAFGQKMARGTGSVFNIFVESAGSTLFFPVHALFFAGVIVSWVTTAFLVGNRYNKAIEKNEIID